MDPLLRAELIRDEGLRLSAYKDSVGLYTIGIGHLLGDTERMSVITLDEAYALFAYDVDNAITVLKPLIPAFSYWLYGDSGHGGFSPSNTVRCRALINMAFNLGHRLGEFSKFLAAVNTGDWHTASLEMLNSTWAHQVGFRALRLSYMIENDKVM